MTPHINASFDSIAPFVIITGDPLRVQKMSLFFLTKPKLVSDIRNNYIYTGYYKGNKVSIASGGMGTSSIAIYVQELCQFYNVKVILRVGSCGSFRDDLKLLSIVNVEQTYSDHLYYPDFYSEHWAYPSTELVAKIKQVSREVGMKKIDSVKAITETEFYPQVPSKTFAKQKIYLWEVVEMEAYALFVIAKQFNCHAGCLLTVSDQLSFTDSNQFFVQKKLSTQQRVEVFHSAFKLALETSLQWKN